MILDPAIARLRSDPAPQQQARAAMIAACDRWRAEPILAEVTRDLDRFGAGAALEECPALERMFTQSGDAEALAGAFTRIFAEALAGAPLGLPPLRHTCDGSVATLLLAWSGRAQIQLQAREPGRYAVPEVSFRDAARFDAVLAGAARASVVHRCEPDGDAPLLWEEGLDLTPGARLAFDCTTEALVLEEVSQRFICLRLHRTPAHRTPARHTSGERGPTTEHDRASGRILHRACGDLSTSRREMMVALLGRMERADCVPTLAAIAAEPGEASLRWEALRECLALDTAAGFAVLCAIARSAADPLAGDAGALRAQLIETHPQLRDLEMISCPE